MNEKESVLAMPTQVAIELTQLKSKPKMHDAKNQEANANYRAVEDSDDVEKTACNTWMGQILELQNLEFWVASAILFISCLLGSIFFMQYNTIKDQWKDQSKPIGVVVLSGALVLAGFGIAWLKEFFYTSNTPNQDVAEAGRVDHQQANGDLFERLSKDQLNKRSTVYILAKQIKDIVTQAFEIECNDKNIQGLYSFYLLFS